MKILVFSFRDVRDILFSTPLIRALKTQIDGVRLHYVMPSDFHFLAEDNPYIDEVFDRDANIMHLLRVGQYELIIDLENRFSIRWMTAYVGVRLIQLKIPRFNEWLMVKLKINKLDGRHLIDHLFDSVDPLELKQDELGLDYFIPEKDHVPSEWLPEDFQSGFVLFSIEARFETRRLPHNRIIELCDKINKPVILVGSTADTGLGDMVEQFFRRTGTSTLWEEGLTALNKKAVVYNGCGKFNSNQVASLVRQSIAVFTFDNTTVAVASAFRKQVYLILGNTISLFGRYPYKTKFVLLENNKVACRPCSTKGFNACPLKHFNCMNKVVFDFYIP